MLLKDHITTAVPSPLIGENIEELGPRFPDMSEVYSERMREIAIFCAKKLEIPIQEGVYVQFTGPNYETPGGNPDGKKLGGRCGWNEYSM